MAKISIKGEKLRKVFQHDYSYVKSFIESFPGYKLLSELYVNNGEKIDICCPKGHLFKMGFWSFQSGQRCKVCANNNKRMDYEEVKKRINIDGYVLLSETYINTSIKLDIKCPKDHIFKMTVPDFHHMGNRCPQCNILSQRHTIEHVRSYIESEPGYKLLSNEYINARTKLDIQCKNLHVYKVTWCNFKLGYRCPSCKIRSKVEKKILGYVKEIYNGEIIENNWTQLVNPKTKRSLELDIWLPELMKAIEYNGNYYHSSEGSKFRDNIKVEQCKEKGINLLVINEDRKKINDQLRCCVTEFINGKD